MSQSQEIREMFHARFDCCLVLQLIRILTLIAMSNFDINVDRQTDERTEKQMPMSQSQEVIEMFHARSDGCLVLQLMRILTLT